MNTAARRVFLVTLLAADLTLSSSVRASAAPTPASGRQPGAMQPSRSLASAPADGCPAENALCSLLRYAPDVLGRDGGDDQFVEYVNFAAQLSAVGIEPPNSVESESYVDWYRSMPLLPFFLFSMNPFQWPDDFFGFNLGDIDEYLMAGNSHDPFIVLHGRFDETRLVESWTRSGYAEYRVGDVCAWSIRDDHMIDL
jgi:hypothetical protein